MKVVCSIVYTYMYRYASVFSGSKNIQLYIFLGLKSSFLTVISERGTILAVVDTASIQTASPSAPVAAPRCTERIKDSSGDGDTRSGK